ncbi:hypothetical protein GCM10011494_18850 [Novosphingobium endophyticum]|uniref:DUF1214 domain-containing protein n=2 Tax=Novosphingobium endophyticum TaxID=1955250 RepID=A0A916X4I8_9SPHN|nr:hypothetical protein GCM10011494_18850 [Novosphingobium endophyticum]
MTQRQPSDWADFLDMLKAAAELIRLTSRPSDPQMEAELSQQLLTNIATAYFIYFLATPEHPDWIPLPSLAFIVQPNPDDIYLRAPLRGDLTYRIVGERGTARVVTLGIKEGLVGTAEPPHPMLNFCDVDTLELEADGSFELLLSQERPLGHVGNWLYLDPRATTIQARFRFYDWAKERDGRLAIECLDSPVEKPVATRAEIAERLGATARYVERYARTWMDYQQGLRDRGMINTLEFTAFAELGGLDPKLAAAAVPQHYWSGIFELGADEALILETALPDPIRYWNVQLNDPLFNAVDYVNRQSSLNGSQARLDEDGLFRAVISAVDPGVPNWLDTAGFSHGTLIGRWFGCGEGPLPSLTKVPLAAVRDFLPKDTPVMAREDRAGVISARRRAAQMRRHW